MRLRSAWFIGVACSVSAPALAQSNAVPEAPPVAPAPSAAAPVREAAPAAAEPPQKSEIEIPPSAPVETPPPPPPPEIPPTAEPPVNDVSPAPLPPQGPPTDSALAGASRTPPAYRAYDFSAQLGIGVNGRFGQASGYTQDSGIGPSYALGLWLNASAGSAFGVELTHTRLGHGSAQDRASVIDTDFSSSALWLAGRFFPYHSPDFGLYLGLRLGLALEHVAATGLAQDNGALTRGAVFDCSGTHGPALGLGAGIGGVLHLNSRLDLVSELGAHGEQLTSERVGNGANGVGSVGSLGWGLSLAYGFGGGSASSGLARAPRAGSW
jgi:hypothetical protein